MEMLTLPKNRGYLIAGIGAIIALLAFLFLPYIAYSMGPISGSISGTQVAGYQGFVWLEALLPLAVIALASLLAFRSNPFGMTATPIATQIRYGIYSLLGVGVLSLLLHIILAINANGSIQAISGNPFLGSIISVGFGIGFWLYLLSAFVIIGGAIYALRTVMSTIPAAQPQSWQYPPQSQQYPPQSQEYPQQYPPQSQQYSQQYPPQSQQYSQQYPPQSQQYPPYQQQPPPQYPPYQQQPPEQYSSAEQPPPQQWPPS